MRKIIPTNLKTGKQKKYNSINEVSQVLQINPGSIKLIADGEKKQHLNQLIKNLLLIKLMLKI